MKKPRAIIVISAIMVFAALCGCNKAPAQGETTVTKQTTAPTATAFEPVVEGGTTAPYFRLSALPKLEPYKPAQEIFTRLREEYTDRLVPSDSYGELVPFRGAALKYYVSKEDSVFFGDGFMYSQQSATYGLATLDGKIVVDPVYTNVDRRKLDNGKYIYFLNEKTGEMNGKVTAAASDGSWVIEGDFTTGGGVSENRIILGKTTGEPGEGPSGTENSFFVYDYNGKYLFRVDGVSYLTEYSEGYAAVNTSWYGDGKYTEKSWFIDANGKKVFGDYKGYAGAFQNGYAQIYADNFEGYIDTSGRKHLEIPISAKSYINEEDYWRFKSKETGLKAEISRGGEDYELFCCTDNDGMSYVFDRDGSTVAKAYGITEICAANTYCVCVKATDKAGKSQLHIIERETNEIQKSFDISRNAERYDNTYAYEYYRIDNIFEINEYRPETEDSKTVLYDCEKKKVIYEGTDNIWSGVDIYKINGTLYFGEYEGDFSVLYDENNNIIMRVNTNSTD